MVCLLESCVHVCRGTRALIDCQILKFGNDSLFLFVSQLSYPTLLFLRFELLGMHRNVQHRVDYMDWAPGLATYYCLECLKLLPAV